MRTTAAAAAVASPSVVLRTLPPTPIPYTSEASSCGRLLSSLCFGLFSSPIRGKGRERGKKRFKRLLSAGAGKYCSAEVCCCSRRAMLDTYPSQESWANDELRYHLQHSISLRNVMLYSIGSTHRLLFSFVSVAVSLVQGTLCSTTPARQTPVCRRSDSIMSLSLYRPLNSIVMSQSTAPRPPHVFCTRQPAAVGSLA